MRHLITLGALCAFGAAAGAQQKLVGYSVFRTGVIFETTDFGTGLAQSTSGGDVSIVKSARQVLVPLSFTMPFGDVWSADVATVVSRGQATFSDGLGGTFNKSLTGLSDVRLRATGKLIGDGLVATLGVNVPTGARALDPDQVAALGVLAAPALGIYLPSVSLGPSETAGLVAARAVGDWAWALGASYELRNSFSPVAALSAGIADPKFDPGDAVHVSLGTDHFVGESALSLALVADVYTQDKLLAAAGGNPSTVRLGPTLGGDVSFKIASQTFSDLSVYASDRMRASFTRDGASVPNSSANYLTAGLRAVLPLGPMNDLSGGVEVWNHSGLESDNSLVTAKTTMTAITLGLDHRGEARTWRPYARYRFGTIDTGVQSGSVSGISVGMSVLTRF